MIPTNERIERAFLSEYSGQNNVMTNNIHAYGYSLKNPRLYFEISYGRGIFNDWLVGVTVLEITDTIPARKRRTDLNDCFSGSNKWNLFSLAREYGESLE